MRSRFFRLLLLAVAAVLALDAGDALAQSCAMCASSFGENDPVSRAFSWSILFMMAMPYTVFGTIAAVLFWSHRRGAARRRAAVIDLARARIGRHQGDLA